MQDLLAELAAIETVKAEIEEKLAEATQTAKTAMAEEFRASILSAGFDPAEIAAMLKPSANAAKRQDKDKSAKGTTVWALKADLSKIYTRGPTPAWMKEAMATAGLNCNKDQRKRFMAEHMTTA